MSLGVLLQASRPKTLVASFFPTLSGVLLAWNQGALKIEIALATISCAILLQVLTNLANDYFDFKKGADTAERIGPVRVTQAGLLAPTLMKQFIILNVFLCLLLGVYLVILGGFPILLTGILSVMFAIGYTAGPYPLAYYGLGEIFSFIFFGLVATGGSFYLQTGFLNTEALCCGVLYGFLSTALLVTNNLRDIDQDAQANKKTIVVRFGEKFGRSVFSFCIYGTIGFLILSVVLRILPWQSMLVILVLPLAKNLSEYIWKHSKKGLVPLFEQIGKYFLIYSILLNIGLLISFYFK